MDDSRRKMLDEILGSMGGGRSSQGGDILKERDGKVRQAIAELYEVLDASKNPDAAINMLAEHASILVEMINEFKRQKQS
ncbi:MAG: hypothetical protein ACRCUT_02210 [Spirochaetota bacterium]